jgi:hypothetical protein
VSRRGRSHPKRNSQPQADPGETADLDRRLSWLLKVGERALLEGNRTEALHAVREAQPFLPRSNGMAAEFERLEKRARAKP